MNSMRRFLLGAAFAGWAVAALAQPAASDAEKLVVGTWYGEFAPGPAQPMQRFLTTRKPDGTFSLQLRIYEKGKPTVEWLNAGQWGVSNNLYTTVTTSVNRKDVNFRDAGAINPYIVRSLTMERFEYEHIPSGNFFRAIRVDPATARLPD